MPGFPVFSIFQSLPKLVSIELVMPSNHLILCCPLLLLPSVFPGIRVFSSESAVHIRWPKYWSSSFSISLSNEHSRLISFKIDLLAVQGTLEYSPAQQFESISSSVLYLLYSPALSVHDYWKTTALAIWTFVGKVMSLLSNTLSRFVRAFLPSSNHLLIHLTQYNTVKW